MIQEIKSPSVRTIIMNMLKTNLAHDYSWNYIEVQLAVYCSELPELSSEQKKDIFVDKLREIKKYLLDKNIPNKSLRFLDEEIDRYENTKQICLYIEEDEELDPDVIEKYSRLSIGSEGVVGIHQPYNYSQLRKLTNGVFHKTGLIRFYISKEKIIYGKIIAEIYDRPQKIPIATLLESKKIDEGSGLSETTRISLFGDKINSKLYTPLKSIEISFYVYRFISELNQEFILLSTESQEIGDYILEGVGTQCDDYKMLTESAKLPTKLPFFFAKTIRNRLLQYDTHKKFMSRVNYLGITRNRFFDYPFVLKNHKLNKSYSLVQPKWFKWLIWSWIAHSSKGLCQNYPLHIFMIGIPGGGKSILLNSLHNLSGEQKEIFSGSSSTVKHLIPSFKNNPAKLGYLAESNRYSYCDEFLRCFYRNNSTKEGTDESVAFLNDLLEHQKREAGSGVSKVKVTMTSRIIATTNPIGGIRNVDILLKQYDQSFLSRVLVYYQPREHVDLIRRSKESELKIFPYSIPEHDWLGFMDYLHSFDAIYDMNIVEQIYLDASKILNETLLGHYEARHKHHIECIIDGIIKTRCFLDKDASFTAIPEDYEILKEIWHNIIKSWVNLEEIRNVPIASRLYYLSADCQYIYWELNKIKGLITRQLSEKIAVNRMSKEQYIEAMVILRDMKLLTEKEGHIELTYLKE